MFFTDQGRCYWRKVYELPEMQRTARGRSIVNVLEMEENERVRLILPVRDFDDRYVVFATRSGLVKKTELKAFSRPKRIGIRAIDLVEGDTLIGVALCEAQQDVMIATAGGRAVRFAATGCARHGPCRTRCPGHRSVGW